MNSIGGIPANEKPAQFTMARPAVGARFALWAEVLDVVADHEAMGQTISAALVFPSGG